MPHEELPVVPWLGGCAPQGPPPHRSAGATTCAVWAGRCRIGGRPVQHPRSWHKARPTRDAPSSDPWLSLSPRAVDLLDSAPALLTGPQRQQDQRGISEADLTTRKVETMSPNLTRRRSCQRPSVSKQWFSRRMRASSFPSTRRGGSLAASTTFLVPCHQGSRLAQTERGAP
jgi:hypothetical protein